MSDPAARKMFIFRKAISFTRANLDELNEALTQEDTAFNAITDDEMDEIQLLIEGADTLIMGGEQSR